MSEFLNSVLKAGDRVETSQHLRGTVNYVGDVESLGAGIFVNITFDDEYIGNEEQRRKNKEHGSYTRIEDCSKIEGVEVDLQATNSNIKFNNGYRHNITIESDTQINDDELDPDEASKKLAIELGKRKSHRDIEQQFSLPNYFENPINATQKREFQNRNVASHLDDFLEHRPTAKELERQNIVPHNYFEDPIASTKGKHLVKEMISSNLMEFHEKRPTMDDLALRNIIPKEYLENERDYEAAQIAQEQTKQNIQNRLNQKLTHEKRPTITDLGDMHIIPHDYLDNLLEDAVTNHTRKQSRMDHVQQRLQKHLPEPVAQTLAETLVTSVQDDDDDEHAGAMNNFNAHNARMNDMMNDSDDDDDDLMDEDEWQISFVYEPMQNFVPMNPSQKEDISEKLERRLSLRPTKQQIEVWGFVPPQYFESPEQSFLRQALGREIAFDLLEGFLPNREDIYQLTNRGIMHPDFITQDHDEAVAQQHQRKQSVMQELNAKLDPRRRPSVMDLGDQGLIPDNWLLELYGLADDVRRRHKRMESAVNDLKTQLNVPPVLADVVARDVLDEIENVDPVLTANKDNNNNNHNHNNHNFDRNDINMDSRERESVNDNENEMLTREIQELRQELHEKNNIIQDQNGKIEKMNEGNLNEMKGMEQEYEIKMNGLQNEIEILKKETRNQLETQRESLTMNKDNLQKEIENLRQKQNHRELHVLDGKAIELELASERLKNEKLKNSLEQLRNNLFDFEQAMADLQKENEQNQKDKLQLVSNTNSQIDQLRSYMKCYQQYYQQNEREKSQNGKWFGWMQ